MQVRHAVLMQVHGIGLLMEGAAGSGKSALALELLSRGHRLIADDAVEISSTPSFPRRRESNSSDATQDKLGPRLRRDGEKNNNAQGQILIGHCPAQLRGLIEVRGLGILDVRRLFGARSCLAQTRIDLVLKLTSLRIEPDRLHGNYRRMRIHGVTLPCLSLPASLGHNLAVYTETACRQLRLNKK